MTEPFPPLLATFGFPVLSCHRLPFQTPNRLLPYQLGRNALNVELPQGSWSPWDPRRTGSLLYLVDFEVSIGHRQIYKFFPPSVKINPPPLELLFSSSSDQRSMGFYPLG